MSDWRMKAVRGLRKGATFTFTRTFTERDTRHFGDITRDYNPVHYSLPFAEAKGIPGLICHGLLVGSMVCELGGQVAWLASGMSFRFMKPVFFGDTITCRITIVEIDTHGRARADAVFENQRGERVMHGVLHGHLPTGAARDVLRAMVDEGDTTNKLSEER